MFTYGVKIFCHLIGLAVITGAGADLHAQKQLRPKTVVKRAALPEPETVPARAGDTLTTIARRAGIHPIQLARLNGLSVSSKLKQGQLIRLPSHPTHEVTDTGTNPQPNGKLLKFADGGSLHVDDAWWQGDVVWYRQGSLTATAPRKVKSIETVFVAQVKPKKESTPRPIASEVRPENAGSTWIYLHGGAKFKVDQVKEQSDGAWYQRGNLLSFLDRTRIQRIERDIPGESPPDWKDRGWTSGHTAIDQLIKSNGNRFGVDPYLVFLVIEQESHFRTRAVSPKGARGLMQLMPGTARRFGVTQSFDPVQNIRGGTQYLKELLTMFNGRVDLALASYNAGEGRVIQYGHKVPPFRETREYVKRIGTRYNSGAGSLQTERKPRVGE